MEVNDRTSFRKQLILLTVKYTYVCMVPHGLNMASQPGTWTEREWKMEICANVDSMLARGFEIAFCRR